METMVADPQAPRTSWARQFWRVALSMGLSFGILTSLLELLIGPGHEAGALVRSFAFKSAFFGLGMAGFMVGTPRLKLKTAIPPPLHPRLTMPLATESEQAIQRVRAALLRIPDSSLVESDPQIGSLVAKTGPSVWSWGEVITARVVPVGPEECLVHLESRPRLRLTVADFGVNAKNLDLVGAALRTAEGAGPVGTS